MCVECEGNMAYMGAIYFCCTRSCQDNIAKHWDDMRV